MNDGTRGCVRSSGPVWTLLPFYISCPTILCLVRMCFVTWTRFHHLSTSLRRSDCTQSSSLSQQALTLVSRRNLMTSHDRCVTQVSRERPSCDVKLWNSNRCIEPKTGFQEGRGQSGTCQYWTLRTQSGHFTIFFKKKKTLWEWTKFEKKIRRSSHFNHNIMNINFFGMCSEIWKLFI